MSEEETAYMPSIGKIYVFHSQQFLLSYIRRPICPILPTGPEEGDGWMRTSAVEDPGMYGMPLVLLFGNYRYLQIFEDISNSFTDICNYFTDILKYLQISLILLKISINELKISLNI